MSIIEVPVNIGTKVYMPSTHPEPHIIEATVYQITVKAVDRRCKKVETYIKFRWTFGDGSRTWGEYPIESLGDYFFLTVAEAEDALREDLAKINGRAL